MAGESVLTVADPLYLFCTCTAAFYRFLPIVEFSTSFENSKIVVDRLGAGASTLTSVVSHATIGRFGSHCPGVSANRGPGTLRAVRHCTHERGGQCLLSAVRAIQFFFRNVSSQLLRVSDLAGRDLTKYLSNRLRDFFRVHVRVLFLMEAHTFQKNGGVPVHNDG
jgi:hypothetical protein